MVDSERFKDSSVRITDTDTGEVLYSVQMVTDKLNELNATIKEYEEDISNLKDFCLKEASWYDSLRFMKPNTASGNSRYVAISEAYVRVCRKIDDFF